MSNINLFFFLFLNAKQKLKRQINKLKYFTHIQLKCNVNRFTERINKKELISENEIKMNYVEILLSGFIRHVQAYFLARYSYAYYKNAFLFITSEHIKMPSTCTHC